jgi:beta-xylosidase
MRGTAPSGGLFAPTLRYNKGYYYLITTWFDIINPPDNVTRTPRSMYVKTKNIFDETQWRWEYKTAYTDEIITCSRGQ